MPISSERSVASISAASSVGLARKAVMLSVIRCIGRTIRRCRLIKTRLAAITDMRMERPRMRAEKSHMASRNGRSSSITSTDTLAASGAVPMMRITRLPFMANVRAASFIISIKEGSRISKLSVTGGTSASPETKILRLGRRRTIL